MPSTNNIKDNEFLSQHYVLAEQWKSDCEFYSDELKFLNSLINKYFIYLIDGDKLTKIQDLATRLTRAEQKQEDLIKDIIAFMGGVKTNITEDNQVYFKEINAEHSQLETRLEDFVNLFKDLKVDIFQITEKILEQDKVKKLIGA